jgi:predicted enzyme related to lactoylglutathione lyase
VKWQANVLELFLMYRFGTNDVERAAAFYDKVLATAPVSVSSPREEVYAFHDAALAAGGRDNGPRTEQGRTTERPTMGGYLT